MPDKAVISELKDLRRARQHYQIWKVEQEETRKELME